MIYLFQMGITKSDEKKPSHPSNERPAFYWDAELKKAAEGLKEIFEKERNDRAEGSKK